MAFPMEFRMDFLKNFSLICKIPTGENKKSEKTAHKYETKYVLLLEVLK